MPRHSKQFLTPKRLSLIIIVLISGWILSGVFSDNKVKPEPENSVTVDKAEVAEAASRNITVRQSKAELVRRYANLNGYTKPEKDVKLAAQTSGQIVQIVAKEGQQVNKGDVLVRIDKQDRTERLEAAKASLAAREQEYEAAKRLSAKGFESEVRRKRILADLTQAKAEVKRLQMELGFTDIKAPFDGMVEKINVKVGDFGGVGVFGVEGAIARIVSLNPILATGNISQADRPYVDMKTPVEVTLENGATVKGNVSYLAHVSEEQTRSFPLEVSITNPDNSIIAGQTVSIAVPLNEVQAHFIPASALSLDDAGALRVKTLDAENRVREHLVQTLREGKDGWWVSGLPEQARIIILGHHYAAVGQQVDEKYIQ